MVTTICLTIIGMTMITPIALFIDCIKEEKSEQKKN